MKVTRCKSLRGVFDVVVFYAEILAGLCSPLESDAPEFLFGLGDTTEAYGLVSGSLHRCIFFLRTGWCGSGKKNKHESICNGSVWLFRAAFDAVP